MRSELDKLCERLGITADVKYGAEHKCEPTRYLDPHDPRGCWKCSANPWTVTLKFKRRRLTVPFWTGIALTNEPTAADVLACLISDTREFIDRCGASFEEWCSDFGYDTDSRQAETVYRQCEQLAPKVERFCGDALSALQAAEH